MSGTVVADLKPLMNWNTNRYAVKIGIVTLVILIVTGAAGVFILNNVNEQARQDVQSSLTGAAATQADQAELWIVDSRARVSEATIAFNTGQQEAALSQFDQSKTFSGAYVVDTESGDIVARGEDESLPSESLDTASADRFVSAVSASDNVAVVGPYEPSSVTGSSEGDGGQATIAFASRIDSSRILIAQAGQQAIERLLFDSPEYDTALVDGSTKVSFATGNSLSTGTTLNGIENSQSFFEVDAGETSFAVGTAPVEGTDWTVTAHQPVNQAYASVDSVIQPVLIFCGILFLILVLFLAVVVRNTSQSMNDVADRIAEIEAGNYDVSLESPRTDEMGRIYSGLATMRDSIVENSRQSEEAKKESERLSKHVQEQAARYEDRLEQVADGDLTARLPHDEENDAMDRVAQATNETLDSIEQTVGAVYHFSEEVADESQLVNGTARQINDASNQVTESVEAIAAEASKQSEQIDETAESVEDLSANAQQASMTADDLADLSSQLSEQGVEGREAGQRALASLEEIESSAEEAAEGMEELQEMVVSISEFADSIDTIARRVNTLALNANIEASRAEDGGGGARFKAVADEIKALAEDSQNEAAEIKDSASDIQQNASETAEQIAAANAELAEQTTTIRKVIDTLNTVADIADETDTTISYIVGNVNQQAETTEDVVSFFNELDEISDRTANSAAKAAAAAEEQTSAVATVTTEAGQLAEQAEALRETIETFDLG